MTSLFSATESVGGFLCLDEICSICWFHLIKSDKWVVNNKNLAEVQTAVYKLKLEP